MKEKVKNFLSGRLGLTLSDTKTKVTNIRKGEALFLGTILHNRETKGNLVSKGKRQKPHFGLKMPMERVMKKLKEKGYIRTQRRGKPLDKLTPKPRLDLTNLDHKDIIQHYNSILRGIANYYSFVDNRGAISAVVYVLKHSCAMTLAAKYKLKTRSRAYKAFGKDLICPETKASLVTISLKRRREFQETTLRPDDLMKTPGTSFRWTKNIMGRPCVVCGSPGEEMHHIRKIWDLKQKAVEGTKKEKWNWFTSQMKAINRKQIPLCKEHHVKLHANDFTFEEKEKFRLGLKQYKRNRVGRVIEDPKKVNLET